MAAPPPPNPIIQAPWTAYRTWAATARFHKSNLDFWRRTSLILAVSGAVLAAIGQQLAPLIPKEAGGIEAWMLKLPALVGSAAIALSAYFTREVLGGEREKTWIKARSIAESCKAAIFLYRSAVPPFDGPQGATALLHRVRDIEGSMTDIEARTSPPETQPDLSPLTVDAYRNERVTKAISWYTTRALEYQKHSDRLGHILLLFGAISVLLGFVSTTSPVNAWIAVIATVTAALTAYGQNMRYQALTVLYQATSRRLQELQAEWLASGKGEDDRAERNSFIQRCEDTMALESSAWVAQWTPKKPDPAKPASS